LVTEAIPVKTISAALPAMSARRILIFGGIALIAMGMLFGDVFAVFVLHQNGGATGAALMQAANAAAAQDAAGVKTAFAQIGNLMEDRGTKVDSHVHMIDAGYLALLVALVQPYVLLSQAKKKLLAKLLIIGGLLLPVGIFLIHYVGLAYSPFSAIGWASVLADSAGALLIVCLAYEGLGVWRYFRSGGLVSEPEMPRERSWERRALLSGGTLLILLGFLHGAWYSAFRLYHHENHEIYILKRMSDFGNESAIQSEVNEYGMLQVEKAVHIAAHSHIIEFGLLAILLSFVQPFVFLSEQWKRRWVKVLLLGSVILPLFVLLELRFGLLAGGIADLGGVLVIIALVGMLVGVVRYTGRLDGEAA
jgi:hypothetical protein